MSTWQKLFLAIVIVACVYNAVTTPDLWLRVALLASAALVGLTFLRLRKPRSQSGR